ncbi:MAG TPA: YiiX/YebB-like N1pC/P60 family cysteine hydrolase [Nevskia sp.]|nr:YiiX/YebB-like N1pC/P60 family cysteine hydrolase [Nevskia sp.]
MSLPYPLQNGDIVFIATRGFLFRKVARATGSKASHVGIAFKDPQRGWVVAESAIPRSRYSPLERFLARSDERWFVVRRLGRELTTEEVQKLRAACDARMGQWYHTGFKFDSARMFCSKFVHEAYREALGLDIGTVETFSELLHRNPEEKLGFWKWWFFGRIPWARRTITPASQLESPLLRTVVQSGQNAGAANGRGSLAA